MWEVDDSGLVFVAEENVEFVEVAVNETTASQTDNEVHELRIETGHVRDTVNVAAGHRHCEGVWRRGNGGMGGQNRMEN